ncbi:MAG: alpha/beta fold hydrolase [Pseudomonadota bacterium]|nr:alpha/beta fold hydrolase [Pseudomonadota bacterium]
MNGVRESALQLQASDGHSWNLIACVPARVEAALLWLPALGVAARHYRPFALELAARGVAVFIHEWRGHGSSSVRASRDVDWGYEQLLQLDLPSSEAAIEAALPGASRIIGGHSLGGQLAQCRAVLRPAFAGRLWLVASGSPYWRAFARPEKYFLPWAYRFLPWLADRAGALPGRRIGFGGQEARGVIRDWSHTALSGRYESAGAAIDCEEAMSRARPDVDAVVLSRDWLAPASSVRFLLSKMPLARARLSHIETSTLGVKADHFAWMNRPDAVVNALLQRP